MVEQNKSTSITINDISIILNMMSVAIDRGAYVENEIELVRNLRDKLNQFVSAALVMQAKAESEMAQQSQPEQVAATQANDTETTVVEPVAKKTRTKKKI